MASSLLAVKNLSLFYPSPSGGEEICVVNDISFELEQSKILGIVGESGSGKTQTALACIRLSPEKALLKTKGIFLEDKNLFDLTEKDMCGIRGKDISMIFQEPMTSLNPVFSIGYQIKESLFHHKSMSESDANKRALELLDLVGLKNPTRLLKQYPHEISGGMRQRVMIAIALACEPKLLIADEPTTALDVTTQAQILELLKKLQEDIGLSILLITHDLGVVAEVCDDVLVMYSGKIVEKGSLEQIFTNPSHPYTDAILKAIPRLGSKGSLKPIPGMIPAPGKLPKGCIFHPRCAFAEGLCFQQSPKLESLAKSSQSSACFYKDQFKKG